jgi:hypothetical protein
MCMVRQTIAAKAPRPTLYFQRRATRRGGLRVARRFLERLRTENAALKKGASSGIRMKVSEKGAVSIQAAWGAFP